LFGGCAPSIDGDNSDEVKEEGSTDEGELDELLRWPPEMRIAPTMSRRRSSRKDKRYAETTRGVGEPVEGREAHGLGAMGGNWQERAGMGSSGHPALVEFHDLGMLGFGPDPGLGSRAGMS
jgi:hypothetical protein